MTARPTFPNELLRDLSPEVVRAAVFVIVIRREPRDGGLDADKTVASSEGSRCVLPAREAEPVIALDTDLASLPNG
jgi:hypothetical protein